MLLDTSLQIEVKLKINLLINLFLKIKGKARNNDDACAAFIHAFSHYLLSVACMQDTILGFTGERDKQGACLHGVYMLEEGLRC